MTDWTPTGSDEQLHEIVRDEYACTRDWSAWGYGTMTEADFTPMGETEIVGDLLAWRDAAVARALAEAGAVHPKVHTSTRIMNYLERHGWQRVESPQRPVHASVFWSPPGPDEKWWVHPCGIGLTAPLSDDVPNYADIVRVLVNRIAWANARSVDPHALPSQVPSAAGPEIMLEISQQPDEVAW
jgi:hypothetical protein